jgi:hypothetical protein
LQEGRDGICAAAGTSLVQLDVQVITAPSLRLDLEADRARLDQTVARLKPRLLVRARRQCRESGSSSMSMPVADRGAPSAGFRLAGCPAIGHAPGRGLTSDRLWTYANADLGFYGWLHVVGTRVQTVLEITLMDLPNRSWRDEYNGRVLPDEAADIAIDEIAAATGLGCAATNTSDAGIDDGSYPPSCSNPDGHSWVVSEETGRCYCEYCLADGDA